MAAAVIQSFSYDAYGNAIGFNPAQAQTNRLYNAEVYNALARSIYMRARDYAPSIARFYGLDPYAGNQSNPISFNKYLFGNSDGANNIDPTGWTTGGEMVMTMGTGVTVAGLKAAAVYVAKQAAISAVQTGVEFAVMKMVFPNAKFDVYRTFGTNLTVNIATGGIGNFWVRNLMDIFLNTAFDVGYGEDWRTSVASNILGSFGGEIFAGKATRILKRSDVVIESVAEDAIEEGTEALAGNVSESIAHATADIASEGSAEAVSNKIPQWLRNIIAGNRFNKLRRAFYPVNELYIVNPSGGYFRLDSYNPQLGEIVSRKYTQFGGLKGITEKTAFKYLDELVRKYPPDSVIAKVPSSNVSGVGNLGGELLQGQMFLEVPEQLGGIPQAVLD